MGKFFSKFDAVDNENEFFSSSTPMTMGKNFPSSMALTMGVNGF
jgi:hypothetical protein